MPSVELMDKHFPRYTRFGDPAELGVPVWCCTPGEGRSIHRFFDTSPISPDGRYLAVFRMPFEDHLPEPGDVGEVVLIDLENGGENVIATTRGWEPQMGCNLNWSGDRHVVFNDIDTDTWTPQVVRLHVESGEESRWPGGVYHVSPDGRYAAAASMEKMRRTQPGYGVVVPDEYSRANVGAVDDDGLFIMDLETGERELVLTLADAIGVCPELAAMSEAERNEWEIYGFHSKWNSQGDRLIFTIRRYQHQGKNRFDAFGRPDADGGKVRYDVLTVKPDGSDVHDAVPADLWEHGGHHINFFPDGQRLSANIKLEKGAPLSLIQVDYDGSNFGTITDDVVGSGHPTVHPDGRHILADTYAREKTAYGDGTVPLRWIDHVAGTEQNLLRIGARVEPQPTGVLRVDPHPAWDADWRWVAFNGVDETNTRRVYIADFTALIGE